MTPLLAITCVLSIIFVLILIECILRKKVSYVIENLDSDENVIEMRIREIINANPTAEIIILCTPKSPDAITILNKICYEFPQLHIIS